jgi:hypothetical protein
VQAGNGQVFQCLLMNKHDQRMQPKVGAISFENLQFFDSIFCFFAKAS